MVINRVRCPCINRLEYCSIQFKLQTVMILKHVLVDFAAQIRLSCYEKNFGKKVRGWRTEDKIKRNFMIIVKNLWSGLWHGIL